MPESLQLTVAKLLLKRTLFDTDSAGPHTIWKAQQPEVRKVWLTRADDFIADLRVRGLEIKDI